MKQLEFSLLDDVRYTLWKEIRIDCGDLAVRHLRDKIRQPDHVIFKNAFSEPSGLTLSILSDPGVSQNFICPLVRALLNSYHLFFGLSTPASSSMGNEHRNVESLCLPPSFLQCSAYDQFISRCRNRGIHWARQSRNIGQSIEVLLLVLTFETYNRKATEGGLKPAQESVPSSVWAEEDMRVQETCLLKLGGRVICKE